MRCLLPFGLCQRIPPRVQGHVQCDRLLTGLWNPSLRVQKWTNESMPLGRFPLDVGHVVVAPLVNVTTWAQRYNKYSYFYQIARSVVTLAAQPVKGSKPMQLINCLITTICPQDSKTHGNSRRDVSHQSLSCGAKMENTSEHQRWESRPG